MSANTIQRANARGCNCSYCSDIRNSNPSKKRFNVCSRLRKAYRITMQSYLEMLKLQENVCMICLRTPEQTGRKFAVDHNHRTGEIRGLLCSNCNTAIGLLGDHGGNVYRAAMYLQGYNGN